RQRDKTRAAIRQMAIELLDLYARRQLAAGFAFPPDTPWQRELESAFLYEDTPDQRRASEEVKRDMERALPMDRLLVGDVGYGKRSEEHTSELQSRFDLVCRLLLEKKKKRR